jgi:energy-coupling factor transporter transmembrane protein EcfT
MIYSYTLDPVAMPSFDMFLFMALSIIFSIILCILVGLFIDEAKIPNSVIGTIFGVVTSVAVVTVFVFMFNSYRDTPIPKNEVVCGKRLDFSSNTVGGKSKSLAGFVQYEMCDGSGIVTIRTNEQKSYPEQLNFYKN